MSGSGSKGVCEYCGIEYFKKLIKQNLGEVEYNGKIKSENNKKSGKPLKEVWR
jgi:hypothetical protein